MSDLSKINPCNYEFSWKPVGNIDEGRKNLGPNMPVFAYRLFEHSIRTELNNQYGEIKSAEILHNAGKISGLELANSVLNLNLPIDEFLSHICDFLEKNHIGILRIEEFNQSTGYIRLTISEDLDCSGLPVTGETVCSYDEGLLAGILEVYTKKEYQVEEIDCWATGARVCRFEGYVKNKS
jgi:predicted hydrocarbon binding protein